MKKREQKKMNNAFIHLFIHRNAFITKCDNYDILYKV